MAQPEASAPRSWRGWTRGEGIIVVAGILLVADLLLLPWHHYALNVDVGNLGIDLPTFSLDRNGVQSPNAGFGIAALLLTVLMVVLVLAAKARATPPTLGQLHLIAGPGVLGLLLAKLFSNDEFLGSGAWLGVLLAMGLAVGGYLASQDTSGNPGTTVGRNPEAGPVSPT